MSSQANPQKPRKAPKPKVTARPRSRWTAEDEDDVRAALEVLNDPDEVFTPAEEIEKKYGFRP